MRLLASAGLQPEGSDVLKKGEEEDPRFVLRVTCDPILAWNPEFVK